MIERRKFKRITRQIPVKIADKSFDVITETANISSQGAYCRISRLLPLMSRIEMILLIPSKSNGKGTKKIKCVGVIVRSEPVILEGAEKAHYNVAIFFTDVAERNQKIIEDYVSYGN